MFVGQGHTSLGKHPVRYPSRNQPIFVLPDPNPEFVPKALHQGWDQKVYRRLHTCHRGHYRYENG